MLLSSQAGFNHEDQTSSSNSLGDGSSGGGYRNTTEGVTGSIGDNLGRDTRRDNLRHIALTTLQILDDGEYFPPGQIGPYDLRAKILWTDENTRYYGSDALEGGEILESEFRGKGEERSKDGNTGVGEEANDTSYLKEKQGENESEKAAAAAASKPHDDVNANPKDQTPVQATASPDQKSATPDNTQTSIFVGEYSTLVGARKVHLALARNTDLSAGKKIGVLNFASAKTPGGGFINGSQAQEESLARSSTLYPSLITETASQFYTHYHEDSGNTYYTHAMVYSPGVVLIRDDNGEWCSPVEVDVLTSAAVNAGETRRELEREERLRMERVVMEYWKKRGEERRKENERAIDPLSPPTQPSQTPDPDPNSTYALALKNAEIKIEQIMYARISRILRVFQLHQTPHLILGSFGTGVFKNRIDLVATIFADLLIKPGGRFKDVFQTVVFAILGKETVRVFSDVFSRVAQREGTDKTRVFVESFGSESDGDVKEGDEEKTERMMNWKARRSELERRNSFMYVAALNAASLDPIQIDSAFRPLSFDSAKANAVSYPTPSAASDAASDAASSFAAQASEAANTASSNAIQASVAAYAASHAPSFEATQADVAASAAYSNAAQACAAASTAYSNAAQACAAASAAYSSAAQACVAASAAYSNAAQAYAAVSAAFSNAAQADEPLSQAEEAASLAEVAGCQADEAASQAQKASSEADMATSQAGEAYSLAQVAKSQAEEAASQADAAHTTSYAPIFDAAQTDVAACSNPNQASAAAFAASSNAFQCSAAAYSTSSSAFRSSAAAYSACFSDFQSCTAVYAAASNAAQARGAYYLPSSDANKSL